MSTGGQAEPEQDTTHGLRLMERLAEEGRFIFSTAEAKMIAAELSIPSGYLNVLLAGLAQRQWLIRLRRGLYALYAGTGYLTGRLDIHPFAIATRLVEPSAISHQTALHHHV